MVRSPTIRSTSTAMPGTTLTADAGPRQLGAVGAHHDAVGERAGLGIDHGVGVDLLDLAGERAVAQEVVGVDLDLDRLADPDVADVLVLDLASTTRPPPVGTSFMIGWLLPTD